MTSTLTWKRSSHPECWVGFSHVVSDQTLVLLFTRLSILLRWSSSKVLIRGAFLVPPKYLGQQKPKIFWRNVWLFTNFADYGFIVYFSMCPTHKIVWFCKTEITRFNSENNCSIFNITEFYSSNQSRITSILNRNFVLFEILQDYSWIQLQYVARPIQLAKWLTWYKFSFTSTPNVVL